MNYEEIESLAKQAQEFRSMLQDVLEEQQKIAKSPNPSPDWIQRVADRKEFAVRHLAGIREDLIKEVTGNRHPAGQTERENEANWNLQEGNR